MWVILDSSAVLDLVERSDAERRQLVTRLKEIAGPTGFNYPEDQQVRLWVPPIAVGELALLTFPAYRVTQSRVRLSKKVLNNKLNVAWEAISLLDPEKIGNLRQRLPSLNFVVTAALPNDAVASLAWQTFTKHRKNQQYLHCDGGRIKSIGDTADQLAFELAYALAFTVQTGAVLMSSDSDLLGSAQQIRTYQTVKLALIDSKNPTRRLQGDAPYMIASRCPGDMERCQGMRTDDRTECTLWPRQVQIK